MIAKRILDSDLGESFDFIQPYPISTLDGNVPVSFAGRSGEGDIYETPLGSIFLVRYGSKEAERIG